ncbi:hypothetical protein Bca4012_009557 [Brassica carinata]
MRRFRRSAKSKALASGRCSSVVEARLLRYWEARNVKRGGELMWVDMLMVDVNSGNPQIDGHKRCKRKNMKRLGGDGLPLHIFANLKSNNSHKNAFINPSWKVWGEKGDEQVAAKKELLEHFKTLETELGDKTYCGGEVFRKKFGAE